jgi:hypothetical protein
VTEEGTSGTPATGSKGAGAGRLDRVQHVSSRERFAASAVERFCSNAVLVFAVGCGAQARNEGHLVDALALRGDEGRSTLR